MTGTGDDVSLDPLTAAVVEAARHAAADEGWDGSPRLYALARREALASPGSSLPAQVSAAADDALIPIEQDTDRLPEGDLGEVLAGIRWPAHIPGCVLATEVPVEGDGQREGDHAARYACALQHHGDSELILGPGLADGLVRALLGTL